MFFLHKGGGIEYFDCHCKMHFRQNLKSETKNNSGDVP